MKINLKRRQMQVMAELLDATDPGLAARIRALDRTGQEREYVEIDLSSDDVRSMKASGAAKRMTA